jgi:bifunctional UDP-N-acetylglucosamine pyrophosphorylase/glucosamine-1-phosphate N-acetyltransferase
MEQPLTVLILAAGLGTRMKSRQAKVLHRVGGLTLIEHVIDTARELTAPDRILVVVGYQAEQVQAATERHGSRFVRQPEQKGTGHAVMMCRNSIPTTEGQLLVLYGDVPLLSAATLRGLIEQQRESGAAAALITTELDDPTGYGRVIRDGTGNVSAIIEQKAATPEQLTIREINAGIYCFDAHLLWKHISEIQPNNPVREYYLTDIVEIFRRAGYSIAPFFHKGSQELLGINTKVELAAIDNILRERTVRRLMLDGVTIEKPETVTIDAQVRIGIDTVVEPFAQILGNTVIGEDCHIGMCSIVRDSEIGDGAVVAPLTIVNDSQIESGARVGPFARLRVGNHVEKGAQVGNFVELKNTRLGAQSKSMHLSYLGDSTIGEKVNIGAGTITCNYDGVKKHQTKIGSGAFVGSNATLVAPVEVGESGYIAAGSVITEAVPKDALALGRSRQVNKPGWVSKRFKKAAGTNESD